MRQIDIADSLISATCRYCDFPAWEGCSPAQRSSCGQYHSTRNPMFGKRPAPAPEPEFQPTEDEHYDPLDALLEDEPEPAAASPNSSTAGVLLGAWINESKN